MCWWGVYLLSYDVSMELVVDSAWLSAYAILVVLFVGRAGRLVI